MEKNSHRWLTLIKGMAFVLILVPGLLLFLVSTAYSLNGSETQVTTNEAAQTDPAISGDYIVYTDGRNGNQDIYLYQISSKTETNLTPGTPNDQYLQDVDGQRVVYTDVVSTGSDIFLYDISRGLNVALTGGGTNYSPAINGTHVVWTADVGSSRAVMLADLASWTATTVTAPGALADTPRVDGDWVVWHELVGAAHEIRAYQISTKETKTLATGTTDRERPDVSGGLAVWADERNGNWDIYSYDLATGTERRVTTDPENQQYPRIDETRVVWEDDRSGVVSIWTKDLSGGVEEPVSPSTHTQILNAVDGNRVVWAESRYGDFDIFMFTIEAPPPPPPVCGDSKCSGIENCSSCPQDCGICAPVCGDGICNGIESCSSCPADCGTCPAICGDGLCNGTESCSSCSADCGVCPAVCGDGLCNGTEDCTTCLEDCGVCPPVCGDGSCNGTETCVTCQEDCGICPTIFVSPLDYNFGEVKQGTSSKTLVTITNLGSNDLTVSSIAPQAGSSLYFTLTPVPSYPIVLGSNANVDIGVAFAPASLGDFNAVFRISSTDPSNPLVDVSFSGTGVKATIPPTEQIRDILAFFDTSVANGTLMGDGPGNSANGRRNALRNMLKATGDMINQGDIDGACEQLRDAYLRTDGMTLPPDFVKGPSSPTLASMIQDLMAALGCN